MDSPPPLSLFHLFCGSIPTYKKQPLLVAYPGNSEVLFTDEVAPLFMCFTLIPDGISAYNAGVNTVQTYDKMIVGKTHNYDDVDARVRFYKRNGY